MIGRNVSLKRELIEQSSLLNLLMPHHDSVPSRRLNQRISPSATADFFNKIDPFETCRGVRGHFSMQKMSAGVNRVTSLCDRLGYCVCVTLHSGGANGRARQSTFPGDRNRCR